MSKIIGWTRADAQEKKPRKPMAPRVREAQMKTEGESGEGVAREKPKRPRASKAQPIAD